MTPAILSEDRASVRVLTINRPQVRNALDVPSARELELALREAAGDDRVTAVVLTGISGVFCAGMDLKYAAAHGLEGIVSADGGFAGLAMREAYEKPIIAAVEGPARAGGFELALACDLVVAARSATFGLPETSRGLVAVPAALRLARCLPRNAALSILLIGRTIDAQRGFELGLIADVVDDGAAVNHAVNLGEELSSISGRAVAATKEIVVKTASLGWAEAEAAALDIVSTHLGRPEAMDLSAVRAFAAGRAGPESTTTVESSQDSQVKDDHS